MFNCEIMFIFLILDHIISTMYNRNCYIIFNVLNYFMHKVSQNIKKIINNIYFKENYIKKI